MEIALILTRLFLATIFLVAGFAKLLDLSGSKKAMADFGLPPWLAKPLGVLLPVAEVLTGVALVPEISAWWGSIGAIALLLLFVTGISVNLVRGRKSDCHCFGQLHSQPIGKSTLIRNVVLAATAAILVWQGRVHPVPRISVLVATFPATRFAELLVAGTIFLMLAVISWFVLNLSRQNGRLLLRIEALEAISGTANIASASAPPQGLPAGTVAPSFQLSDHSGRNVTLEDLRAGNQPVLLVFSDPHCGPCKALMPVLIGWHQAYQDRVKVVIISAGTVEENQVEGDMAAVPLVLLQKEREVAEAYQINGTPGAVLVLPDGTIGSSAAMGAEGIKHLLGQIMGNAVPTGLNGNGYHRGNDLPARPSKITIGRPAPTVRLPDLTGNIIDLREFSGKSVLVLFWNPNCGYCERMLPELQQWEINHREHPSQLVVVSAGTAAINRSMNLHAPVLVNEGFTVGQAFGTSSTPSAVLVDSNGNIASEIATGASDIWKLANAAYDREPVLRR